MSLDALRGLTVAGMILVNSPSSWDNVYAPLQHAEWNGWTLADLVFPFFLFILGVAIPLSLGAGGAAKVRRIFRRAALLFVLGLLLNALTALQESGPLRVPGVLQRIALCYLFASLTFLVTGVEGQVAAIVALLAGYWLLLELVPVGGRVPGVLDPEHNLVAAVDRRIFGEGRLYRDTWDPEGLLSTIPAVASTLFGVLAGHWLRSARGSGEKVAGLVAAGALATLLGEIMNVWMPINKSLWTSSYVVFTAGVALLLLAGCYWLVDVREIRRPALPLLWFGMNPIAVYVLSEVGATLMDRPLFGGENLRARLCHALFAPWAAPRTTSFLFAAGYALAWLAAAGLLYRRKIFIKV